MSKWCPAGKCECELVRFPDNRTTGIAYCIADDDESGWINLVSYDQCPFPKRQVPVDDIAAAKKPRIINGLYIVDESPVAGADIWTIESNEIFGHECLVFTDKRTGSVYGFACGNYFWITGPKVEGTWSTIQQPVGVDGTPVGPLPIRENFLREQFLIFEKAGYDRGRSDMKREIGEKVEKLQTANVYGFAHIKTIDIAEVLVAIAGVK